MFTLFVLTSICIARLTSMAVSTSENTKALDIIDSSGNQTVDSDLVTETSASSTAVSNNAIETSASRAAIINDAVTTSKRRRIIMHNGAGCFADDTDELLRIFGKDLAAKLLAGPDPTPAVPSSAVDIGKAGDGGLLGVQDVATPYTRYPCASKSVEI